MIVTLLVVAVSSACGTSLYVRPELAPGCDRCVAESGDLDARVVLIGDAGEEIEDSANLALLTRLASSDPTQTVVLFLGDNIYPAGMPALDEGVDAERARAERIIGYQVDAVTAAGAAAVFVPGNHDWNRSGLGGLARVVAQQEWIDEHGGTLITSEPRDGCPGPVVIDLGVTVRIVALDTEWLLMPAHRARGDTKCSRGARSMAATYDPQTNADLYSALDQIVSDTADRYLLFATHHPVKTRGEHGGFVPLRYWLFPATRKFPWLYVPLPFVYPLARYGIKRSEQDMVSGTNRDMVLELERIMSTAAVEPAVIASGHEHTLQVLRDGDQPLVQLVSGSGSKAQPTGKNDETIFRHARVGLMVLDYFTDKRVALRVYEPGGSADGLVFSMWLRR